jgi:hypothetical protein
MSRLDQRVRAVELRPISLLTTAEIDGAIQIGEVAVGPETIVSASAPYQFRKIEDAYIYPKALTGLSEDRVEVYLESDISAAVGERIEVSGIHGTSTEDIDVDGDNFIVKYVDTPPWTGRESYKHDPTQDQRSGVTITNTYSFKPETVAPPTWSTRKRLQTRRLVDSFSITGSTVTLTMNAAHKFQVGNVIFVGIFSENSIAYGADGLFAVTAVTDTTIEYELFAGVDTPTGTLIPDTSVYVFPVAREWAQDGSIWVDSANDKTYYWDGIRWVDYTNDVAIPGDGDPPAPPTSLNITSEIDFFKNNTPRVAVTVNWTAPTLTAAGEVLTDLLGYLIKWRTSPSADWKTYDLVDSEATSTEFTEVGLFLDDTLYYFEVYAYDSGQLYSTALAGTHTTADAPATNIATIRPKPFNNPTPYLGTVTLLWGGEVENTSGVTQIKPAGLVFLDIHKSTSAVFTPSSSTLIATISAVANNQHVDADLANNYGTTYYYVAVLRDSSGTESLPSTPVAVTATSLVDSAAISDMITAANITPGTLVTGEEIVGLSITGQIIRGLEINANLLTANSITAAQIDAGSISARLVESGTFRTAASGARVEFNTSGIYGYNSGGGVTFRVLASNGEVFIASGVSIGGYATDGDLSSVNTTATNAASNASTALSTANTANSNASTALSDISNLEGQVYYPGTTQINGGNVRTGTLVADAIGAGTLVAGVVYAGTINADNINAGTLTGRSVQTASSGQRVLLSQSSNSAVFYNGSGSIVGRVQGSTTAGGALLLEGPGTPSIYISSASTQVDGNLGTSGSGNITAAGSLGAVDYVATYYRDIGRTSTGTICDVTSDERAKTNIVNMPSTIDLVNQLRPVTYNWKEAPDDDKFTGLIAQEVDAVFDSTWNIVFTQDTPAEGETEPYMGINYSQFTGVLIKAVQELSTKNDALEARLAALEGN